LTRVLTGIGLPGGASNKAQRSSKYVEMGTGNDLDATIYGADFSSMRSNSDDTPPQNLGPRNSDLDGTIHGLNLSSAIQKSSSNDLDSTIHGLDLASLATKDGLEGGGVVAGTASSRTLVTGNGVVMHRNHSAETFQALYKTSSFAGSDTSGSVPPLDAAMAPIAKGRNDSFDSADTTNSPQPVAMPTAVTVSGSYSMRQSVVATCWMMSEDHKLSLQRERRRINKKMKVAWHPLPTESFGPYLPIRYRPEFLSTEVKKKTTNAGAVAASSAPTGGTSDKSSEKILTALSIFALTNMLIEDGEGGFVARDDDASCSSGGTTLTPTSSLPNQTPTSSQQAASNYFAERERRGEGFMSELRHRMATQKAFPGWSSKGKKRFVIPPVELPRSSKSASDLSSKDALDDTLHGSRKPKNVVSPQATLQPTYISTGSDGVEYLNEANEYEPMINLVHMDSFIARRVSEDGKHIGPEAIFGRFNVSIMMSRSIGDRLGPRSCVCTPEVSAITIRAGEHARFILASDGFWDVGTNEEVRCLAMSSKYKDATMLARHLCEKAQLRRVRGGLRMDDITSMVVDINVAEMIVVKGKSGTSERVMFINEEGQAVEEVSNGCACNVL